jgi:hypothetical protein
LIPLGMKKKNVISSRPLLEARHVGSSRSTLLAELRQFIFVISRTLDVARGTT